MQQYQRDRNPRELLFQLGRCVAHFALDDQEVRFCTHLTGKDSWFEILEEQEFFADPGQQLLIFTEFRDTLDYLVACLNEWGFRTGHIHGCARHQDRYPAEWIEAGAVPIPRM